MHEWASPVQWKGLVRSGRRLASAFLQYAAEFGESERFKAEGNIVRHLVNIQIGYPAFLQICKIREIGCNSISMRWFSESNSAIPSLARQKIGKGEMESASSNYETVVSVDGPQAVIPQAERLEEPCQLQQVRRRIFHQDRRMP